MGQQNGWIPLFRRVSRINGIESYYKQISNKLKPEAKEKVINLDFFYESLLTQESLYESSWLLHMSVATKVGWVKTRMKIL